MYSELMVLSSGAGYYIGRLYTEEEGFQVPGTRESGYFRTAEEAQEKLDNMSF